MKIYKTNRPFFGKYLYKIETYAPGANLIKSWGLAKDEGIRNNKILPRYFQTYSSKDKQILLAYIDAIRPFADKNLKTRSEWNTLNFFVNDQQLFEDLKEALKEWVTSVTQPDSDADVATMLSKSSFVLCNQLPYEVFKYRVYIKTGMPAHHRTKFLEWIKQYPEKYHISASTEKWLSNQNHYFQSPYIYVIDSNQLLLTSLHLGSWQRTTHEFVVRNTQESVK